MRQKSRGIPLPLSFHSSLPGQDQLHPSCKVKEKPVLFCLCNHLLACQARFVEKMFLPHFLPKHAAFSIPLMLCDITLTCISINSCPIYFGKILDWRDCSNSVTPLRHQAVCTLRNWKEWHQLCWAGRAWCLACVAVGGKGGGTSWLQLCYGFSNQSVSLSFISGSKEKPIIPRTQTFAAGISQQNKQNW